MTSLSLSLSPSPTHFPPISRNMFSLAISAVASVVASSLLTDLTKTTFRLHVEAYLSEYVESFEWGQSDDNTITLHQLVMKERAMNDFFKSFGLKLCDKKGFTINHLKLKVNWAFGADLGILSRPWHFEIDGARLCTCIDASTVEEGESNGWASKQSCDIETASVEKGSAFHRIVDNAKMIFRDFSFQCKDATNDDYILLRFSEAHMSSTDHQWNQEETTNEVKSQGTLYKLVMLNDLAVDIEEDERRCCVVSHANFSCKMQKKIKSVLSGSLASDFLGEEYSLLFDINISNPEYRLRDLPIVITWNETTSCYSIVAQEGASLRVSCAVNPIDISSLIKWYSKIAGKSSEQYESFIVNKLNMLNLQVENFEEIVSTLKSRLLISENDLSDTRLALTEQKEARVESEKEIQEKHLQDEMARNLALDEKLWKILTDIENMKSRYSPAEQADFSSIQAMVQDVMSNTGNRVSPRSWMSSSGRTDGSEGYQFGDASRTFFRGFFS